MIIILKLIIGSIGSIGSIIIICFIKTINNNK